MDEEQEVAEQMCDDQKKPDREVVICNTHCQLSLVLFYFITNQVKFFEGVGFTLNIMYQHYVLLS